MILGLILGGMVVWVMKTHVPKELANPFKRGIKKWNGMKCLIYLFLAIGSGVVLYSTWLSGKWVYYLHFFMGIWCLIVGWKHIR
jgi:hypothetical protein